MKTPNGDKFSLNELIGLLIFVKAILTKIAFNSAFVEILCAIKTIKTKYDFEGFIN